MFKYSFNSQFYWLYATIFRMLWCGAKHMILIIFTSIKLFSNDLFPAELHLHPLYLPFCVMCSLFCRVRSNPQYFKSDTLTVTHFCWVLWQCLSSFPPTPPYCEMNLWPCCDITGVCLQHTHRPPPSKKRKKKDISQQQLGQR